MGSYFRDFWGKKILVSRDLKIGRFTKSDRVSRWSLNTLYNEVGVLRDQLHIPSKNWPKHSPPPPPHGFPNCLSWHHFSIKFASSMAHAKLKRITVQVKFPANTDIETWSITWSICFESGATFIWLSFKSVSCKFKGLYRRKANLIQLLTSFKQRQRFLGA